MSIEATIQALEAASTVEDIERALNLIGHKPRDLSFVALMSEQGEADRISKQAAGVKSSELLGRFAHKHPRVVDSAERVNMSSHPKFLSAMLRVTATP